MFNMRCFARRRQRHATSKRAARRRASALRVYQPRARGVQERRSEAAHHAPPSEACLLLMRLSCPNARRRASDARRQAAELSDAVTRRRSRTPLFATLLAPPVRLMPQNAPRRHGAQA